MKKDELAAKLAKQERLTHAAAADQLDRVVHEILSKLRRGEPAPLPGLGKFVPGVEPAFEFENGVPRPSKMQRRCPNPLTAGASPESDKTDAAARPRRK
jgi:hypothetical protein